MASSGVKLLGSEFSPYVNRVQIALNLKSIDYEFVHEDLSNKSELLLKSNPVYKKIPVLIHAENPICESLVILQYIDEAWPNNDASILPSDPHDRAVARFWAAYVEDKWFPLLKEVRDAKGEEEKKATLEKALEGLALLEEAFTKCSKGKSFFGGDNIGYVDIALGCVLGWLKVFETLGIKFLDETKVPCLVEWAQRFSSHEAVKDVIPQPDKIMEYYTLILARKTAAASK